MGREAKIRAAPAVGLRVVGLQHDGIAVHGLDPEAEARVSAALSESVTAACGYKMSVVMERVRHTEVVD